MKIKYLQFLLMFIALNISIPKCLGQDMGPAVSDSTFLSKSENIEWIKKFNKISEKSEQLSYIKEKIKVDTVFAVNTFDKADYWQQQVSNNHGPSQEESVDTINCDCKISFKLVIDSDEYDLDAKKFDYVAPMLEEIDTSKIDTILVKDTFVKNALSKNGQCGTIYLYSEDRSLKRMMRRLLKK